MPEPRRLPMIKDQKAVPPPEAERPAWHWAGIGAVLIFTAWLPLAMLAAWLTRRLLLALVPADALEDISVFLAGSNGASRVKVHLAMLGPATLAFTIAALGGGVLVGRFGGRAGAKEAAVAGLFAASTAWALTAATTGLGSTWFLWPPVAAMGVVFGYVGGRWRRRIKTNP